MEKLTRKQLTTLLETMSHATTDIECSITEHCVDGWDQDQAMKAVKRFQAAGMRMQAILEGEDMPLLDVEATDL